MNGEWERDEWSRRLLCWHVTARSVVMGNSSLKQLTSKCAAGGFSPSALPDNAGAYPTLFVFKITLSLKHNPHPCNILFCSKTQPMLSFCGGHSKGITNNTTNDKRPVMDSGEGGGGFLQLNLACRYFSSGGQVMWDSKIRCISSAQLTVNANCRKNKLLLSLLFLSPPSWLTVSPAKKPKTHNFS